MGESETAGAEQTSGIAADHAAAEIAELAARLAEAEEILHAIAHHAVDAFVVQGKEGEQVYTLKGSDHVYRVIMETMSEGAATLGEDSTIYYCNQAFSDLLQLPLNQVIGATLIDFVHGDDLPLYIDLVSQGVTGRSRGEVRLQRAGGACVPVLLSCSSLHLGEARAACLVATDLTDQKRRTEEMQEAHHRLQQQVVERRQAEAELAEVRRRLNHSQEAERLRLAQELHDGPLQELTAIDLGLSLLLDQIEQPANAAQVRFLLQSVKGVAKHLRALTQNLRPPVLSHLGLPSAMRSYARQVEEQQGAPAISLSLGEVPQHLPGEMKLVLFRIYQQAVQNVIQHADAAQIDVRFWEEQGQLCLEVEDDGRGFRVPDHWVELARQGHLGLVGMAERAESIAGHLEVTSSLAGGTRVRVHVPLPDMQNGVGTLWPWPAVDAS